MMSFWENLQVAADLAGRYHWIALGFIVLALILFIYVPAERPRIKTSVVLFGFSFAGLLAIATLLSSAVAPDSIVYRSLRWVTLLAESIAIINLLSVFVFDVALNAVHIRPPRILRDLLLASAYMVIAFLLLSRSGFDLTGIVATSAVITAVIGFSLADTLGNIMGGMALQMEHTINVGDWVRIDQVEGRVKEIRWRQTSIETRDWDTVVFPNSFLMRGRVTLLGHRTGEPRQHRQWVYFNVDFRYPPTDVIRIVDTALCAEPIKNVAQRPAPHCLVIDFKDSYSAYAVRYWLTDMAQTDPTDSLVRSRIYSALRRAGIPLSIPARSIFVTEETEKRRERKRGEEINRRIDALKRVELFSELTDEERRDIGAAIGAEHDPARLLDALQMVKRRVGFILSAGLQGTGSRARLRRAYNIEFAQEIATPSGRRIIVALDQHWGPGEPTRDFRSAGSEFTLIDVRLGADGKGVGKVVPAESVTFDPKTMSFAVDNYAVQPVRLADVISSKGVRALNSTL